jgi:pyruvate/2-oxoglutarate dehydrogenase complex dihydrolipoamide acyltransferase (E2) component
MQHTVTMPKLGDATLAVVVETWDAEIGSRLEVGTSLMTVETDKVTTEVPSPVAGQLVERLVAVDDEVPVGAPIAVIESAT